MQEIHTKSYYAKYINEHHTELPLKEWKILENINDGVTYFFHNKTGIIYITKTEGYTILNKNCPILEDYETEEDYDEALEECGGYNEDTIAETHDISFITNEPLYQNTDKITIISDYNSEQGLLTWDIMKVVSGKDLDLSSNNLIKPSETDKKIQSFAKKAIF